MDHPWLPELRYSYRILLSRYRQNWIPPLPDPSEHSTTRWQGLPPKTQASLQQSTLIVPPVLRRQGRQPSSVMNAKQKPPSNNHSVQNAVQQDRWSPRVGEISLLIKKIDGSVLPAECKMSRVPHNAPLARRLVKDTKAKQPSLLKMRQFPKHPLARRDFPSVAEPPHQPLLQGGLVSGVNQEQENRFRLTNLVFRLVQQLRRRRRCKGSLLVQHRHQARRRQDSLLVQQQRLLRREQLHLEGDLSLTRPLPQQSVEVRVEALVSVPSLLNLLTRKRQRHPLELEPQPALSFQLQHQQRRRLVVLISLCQKMRQAPLYSNSGLPRPQKQTLKITNRLAFRLLPPLQLQV